MDHPMAQHHRPTIHRLTTATQPDDQDRQEKLGRPAAKPRPPANRIKIKHSTHHHGVNRWNQVNATTPDPADPNIIRDYELACAAAAA